MHGIIFDYLKNKFLYFIKFIDNTSKKKWLIKLEVTILILNNN